MLLSNSEKLQDVMKTCMSLKRPYKRESTTLKQTSGSRFAVNMRAVVPILLLAFVAVQCATVSGKPSTITTDVKGEESKQTKSDDQTATQIRMELISGPDHPPRGGLDNAVEILPKHLKTETNENVGKIASDDSEHQHHRRLMRLELHKRHHLITRLRKLAVWDDLSEEVQERITHLIITGQQPPQGWGVSTWEQVLEDEHVQQKLRDDSIISQLPAHPREHLVSKIRSETWWNELSGKEQENLSKLVYRGKGVPGQWADWEEAVGDAKLGEWVKENKERLSRPCFRGKAAHGCRCVKCNCGKSSKECNCKAINSKECLCKIEGKECKCQRINSKECLCKLGSQECRCKLGSGVCTCEHCTKQCNCKAINSRECLCKIGSKECKCERINSKECTCQLGSQECRCKLGSEGCKCKHCTKQCNCKAINSKECLCKIEGKECKCQRINSKECLCKLGSEECRCKLGSGGCTCKHCLKLQAKGHGHSKGHNHSKGHHHHHSKEHHHKTDKE